MPPICLTNQLCMPVTSVCHLDALQTNSVVGRSVNIHEKSQMVLKKNVTTLKRTTKCLEKKVLKCQNVLKSKCLPKKT